MIHVPVDRKIHTEKHTQENKFLNLPTACVLNGAPHLWDIVMNWLRPNPSLADTTGLSPTLQPANCTTDGSASTKPDMALPTPGLSLVTRNEKEAEPDTPRSQQSAN